MKIVIYSDDKELIKTAEGITRDPPIAIFNDYDAVVAALDQGEDALLFLDYDTDKKVAKKINEHFSNCLAVKRVLISAKLTVRDFKKMQKKDYSCDGYYQKPINQNTFQGIIDDYELIFQMNVDDGTEVVPTDGEETKIGRLLFGNLGKADEGAKTEEKAEGKAEDKAEAKAEEKAEERVEEKVEAAAEDAAPAVSAESKVEENNADAPSNAADQPLAGNSDFALDLKEEETPEPDDMSFTAADQAGPQKPAPEAAPAATSAVGLDLSQEDITPEEDNAGIDAALAQPAADSNSADAAHTAVIGQDELAKLKAAQEQQAKEASADQGEGAQIDNALELDLADSTNDEISFVAEDNAAAPAEAPAPVETSNASAGPSEGSLPAVSFEVDEGADHAAPAAEAPATEVELNDGVDLGDTAGGTAGEINVDADLKVNEDASQTDYPHLPEDISFEQGQDGSGAIDIDAELAQAAAEGDYEAEAPQGQDDFAAYADDEGAAQDLEQELDIDPLAEEDAAMAEAAALDEEEAGVDSMAVDETPLAGGGAAHLAEVTEENFSIDPTSYAKLQGTIRHLREERNSFLDKISKLEAERQQALSDKLGVEAELEELKIELSIIKKRNEDEVQEYKYRARSAEEKKEVFSQKNRTMQRELENLRQQVRVDVNKIKERERQLEGQLELAQMDAAGQIEGRDQKILELKRKIDALEFNMENMAYQQQKAKEDKSKLQDKMNKMMAALRGSIRLIEEDMEVDQVLSEQYRKRAG